MIETKHIIAELSVQEKICLYNALYEDLANKGIDGDTELAHVNKAEMDVLRAMGGSGTINPNTGLIQFGGGGSPPPPPPAQQTVTQQTEFPTELKPFISDVLSKAQAIQEKREAEGFIPFEGPQIAEFTPEQEKAFTGIEGVVGAGQQFFDPATRLAAASASSPRQEEIEQFMSPYMQQVVDIQQREAKRQADVAEQQLGAQAVGAGGFGGSRQAILEAEQQRNLQQQLGDIQARGLASAYEDAQRRIAEQRQRELAASGQFATLGQIAPQQQIRELTALEAIGAQRQAQRQQALDIARSQFEQEQLFPERTLQQYQSVIRGFPLAPTTFTTTQTTTPAPSFLQQAAGLGTAAIGLSKAFGSAKGGKVDRKNGLGSIVVKRQAGSQIGGMQFGGQKFGGQKFGGRRYGGYNPRLKDYPYSPENVEEYKKNLKERIAEKEAILEASGIEQREKMRLDEERRSLDEERRKRISQLEMQRPGLFSELFTQTKDKPALEQQRKDIEAELRMLRNQTSPALEGDKQDIDEGGAVRSPTPAEMRFDTSNASPSKTSDPLADLGKNIMDEVDRNEAYDLGKGTPVSPIKANAQKAEVANTLISAKETTNNPYKIQTYDKMREEFMNLSSKKKDLLKQREQGLDSDRWLAIANLGLNIMSQPGGQTFLEAIGKGAKESGIIGSLAKLNKEKRDIAENLATVDIETLMNVYKIDKDQAAEFYRERDYDFKVKQAEDNVAIARERIAVARTEAERKVAQSQATAAFEQLKMLQTARKPLGKDAQKEWTKQFKDIVKEDNLKTILPEEIIKKFDKLNLDNDDNLKEGLRIKMAEIRALKPSLTERQILREAFAHVYGPYLRKINGN